MKGKRGKICVWYVGDSRRKRKDKISQRGKEGKRKLNDIIMLKIIINLNVNESQTSVMVFKF